MTAGLADGYRNFRGRLGIGWVGQSAAPMVHFPGFPNGQVPRPTPAWPTQPSPRGLGRSVPILSHFGLDGFFDGVYGSELDGARADKRELLTHLLAHEVLAGADCVMIGDRIQDAAAARHVGALRDWGCGDDAERAEAAPDYVCAAMPQLSDLMDEVG